MTTLHVHIDCFYLRPISERFEFISVFCNWQIFIIDVSDLFDQRRAFSGNSTQSEKFKPTFFAQKLNRNATAKQDNLVKNVTFFCELIASILFAVLPKCRKASQKLGSESICCHQYFIAPISFVPGSDVMSYGQSQNNENSLHPGSPINPAADLPKIATYSEAIHA